MRLRRSTLALLQDARLRLRSIERHEVFRRPLERINVTRQLLDDCQRALTSAMNYRVHDGQRRIDQFRSRLDRHMPAALNRLRERVSALNAKLLATITARVRMTGERLNRLSSRMLDRHPKHEIPLQRQRLTALSERLGRAAQTSLSLRRQGLEAMARQLQAVGPENVLRRGYTITMRKKDKSVIHSGATVKPGETLVTRFSDGEVESVAEDPKQPGLFNQ